MFPSHEAGKSLDDLSSLGPEGRGGFIGDRATYGFPRPRSRRTSTTSSVNSVGGSLDSSYSPWEAPIPEFGRNAISTLLQPPIVRTGLQPHTSAPASSNHKAPTARDIPPVTLSNIPIIDVEEFTPYLNQVGALYDQLRRARSSEDDVKSAPREARQGGPVDPTNDGLLRARQKPQGSRRGSLASIPPLSIPESPRQNRRSTSASHRKGAPGPPPLSTIPNVYFDENFRLENPRTFAIVSERSEVIPPADASFRQKSEDGEALAAPRKALATNAILQEKLSWYMDTIEVHLINSISAASTTFFSALGSLKELHSEAADSVAQIKTLRKELSALDEEISASGLRLLRCRRRQENITQLNSAVWQLRLIVDQLARCESLVGAEEMDKALESIAGLERLIAGCADQHHDREGVHLRDLRSLSVLRGIDADLDVLRRRIGKVFEAQLSSILLADLRRHIESTPSSDVLRRWSSSASRTRGGHTKTPSTLPTYLNGTEDLKAQLLAVLGGLHQASHVTAAAIAYRDAIVREIRQLIRRPLPSSNDDDDESMLSVSTANGARQRSSHEKSVLLARNLRAMDPEDAEELLKHIYIDITETLRRLTTQVKVLLDLASSFNASQNVIEGFPHTSIQPGAPELETQKTHALGDAVKLQEELHRALNDSTLINHALDVANDKIVKILRVRSDQTTALPLKYFLRYFSLNVGFANECEALSGRSGSSLKNVVNGQIAQFVQRNRENEMQKLAQGMESDQWNAKDFPEASASLLGHIINSSTQVAEEWARNDELWVPCRDTMTGADPAARDVVNGASRDKTRAAVIDSEKFVLPQSAILCLEGVGNFMQLIAGIPSMTTDVAASLIAYLQLFNSRCTQLILGAGATRSAGLKNITTKHLALASQALAFMATIIPHVREFVRRHSISSAGGSNLVSEFDKVRRQLQEHQESIHQKLVEIMTGRATAHAKSIKAIPWDSQQEADCPHPYLETLVKETTTLHRVLVKHLPESSIALIMQPVFASYKDQLGAALKDATAVTKAGQQSMLRDIDFLVAKLGKLDGFGDTGDFLRATVRAKTDTSAGIDAAATNTNVVISTDGADEASEGVEARATEPPSGVQTNL